MTKSFAALGETNSPGSGCGGDAEAETIIIRSDEPRRPLIVLVDDNEELRAVLARMLEIEGYDVVSSPNPFEVLMLLEATPAALLITDVLMPGMNGITLTSRVRASPGIAWLPIIVFSASDAGAAALEAGADVFIAKESMDWPDLRNAVVQLIGRGVPRAAASSSPSVPAARSAS